MLNLIYPNTHLKLQIMSYIAEFRDREEMYQFEMKLKAQS